MLRILFGTLLAAMLCTSPAAAAGKIALVVGNSAYGGPGADLPNAVSDARAVRDALSRIGYDVEYAEDAVLTTLNDAIGRFHAKVAASAGAPKVVVYYSGHAVQLEETQWIVPTGWSPAPIPGGGAANYGDQDKLVVGMAPTTSLLPPAVTARASLTLLLIDACREMPWDIAVVARGWRRVAFGPGVGERFAPNTLVALAAQPGNTADDGVGGHSPFAAALLKRLSQSHMPVSQMLYGVAADVRGATGEVQSPYIYGYAGDAVCLSECAAARSEGPHAIASLPEDARDTVERTRRAANAARDAAIQGFTAAEEVLARVERAQANSSAPVCAPTCPDLGNGYLSKSFYIWPENLPNGLSSPNPPQAATYRGFGGAGPAWGVTEVNCIPIMLRMRCPLDYTDYFAGQHHDASPAGLGMQWDPVFGWAYFGDTTPSGGFLPKWQGFGVLTLPNGERYEGRWADGKLVEGVIWNHAGDAARRVTEAVEPSFASLIAPGAVGVGPQRRRPQ